MVKPKILFLSKVSSKKFMNEIDNYFTIFTYSDLNETLYDDIQIIWTHLDYKIDKIFLEKFKNIRILVTPTTGINHIDTNYLNEINVSLLSLRNEKIFLKNVTATAEHTWALFLTLQKNIIKAHNSIIKDFYFNRNLFDSTQLKDKTIGIIGLGRIGRLLSEYALSFNMKVSYFDIKNVNKSSKLLFLELDDLLRTADFIFLTASFSLEYKYFFNFKKFNLMKPEALFINTSRGEFVIESDLIYALKNNLITGAALDVFDNELLFDAKINPLVSYAQNNTNLILTPHIGGRSSDALDLVEFYLLEKLKNIYIEKN